ncbi:hypothetical protein GWK47_010887 [Chionoecetes opilio]|uniref:Uncharacterized protein n=1 Tax=Chionoecetes opilio TaxID=41210 RepID=A0A8J5CMR5_CHIOP|nr:hypothetical protein GWK47_010887 [Chionoecetes opilio]
MMCCSLNLSLSMSLKGFAKVQITSFQRILQTLRAHLRSSTSQAIARQHKSARPPKFKIGNICYLIVSTRVKVAAQCCPVGPGGTRVTVAGSVPPCYPWDVFPS